MDMKQAQRSSQLRTEILSIILFALSLVIFLSLISYDANDPSFNVYYTNPQKIRNVLGIVGSHVSDMMFQLFGLVAFFIVLILFQLSFRLFLTLQFPLRLPQGLGWVVLILSSAAILDLSLGSISLGNFSGNAGGESGWVISHFLTKYLNVIGSYIFLALILIISLMISVNFSFIRTGSMAIRSLVVMKNGLNSFITKRKNTIRSENKKIKESDAATPKEEHTVPPSGDHKSQHAPKEPTIVSTAIIDTLVPLEGYTPPKPHPPLASEVFKLPPLSLLHDPGKKVTQIEREVLLQNSRLLENKLGDYGVQAKVINVHPGPVVTLYELEPAPGVKINRIVNLADDLALALRAMGIRIIAPIPGKGVIGVEIPNKNRETVYFKEIVAQEEFLKSSSPLTLGLGKDISGKSIVTDLSAMPHLLIAGTTGSGKSVFINALICSILYKALPSEVKLLIMDPKRSELTFYENIPHLLYPVVTDAKQAAYVLRWAVEEMERRYDLLAKMGARDIRSYNQKAGTSKAGLPSTAISNTDDVLSELPQKMPWIVIIIDELANLMMVSSREVEWSLARLAQMARAAGIHLLVATQRPSVDIITGTIKANFPARISFRLASKTDSRIILDSNGAENLLNQGDMLFLSPRTARLKRIHGPYIADDELQNIVDFLRTQAKPEYQELHLVSPEEDSQEESSGDIDEKYREAVELVTSLEQASISLIQRKLRIGYNRAARIIEKMEEDGIVGPSDGVKPREVLRKMMDI